MARKDDGGPAFPEAIAIGPAGDVHPGFGGMSLRDWFAGHALAGLLSDATTIEKYTNASVKDGVDPEPFFASSAYEMADAMIAERSK